MRTSCRIQVFVVTTLDSTFHFANAGQKLIASATAEPGAYAHDDYLGALHHTQSLLFLSMQFVCR